jgi:hypothetical protein
MTAAQDCAIYNQHSIRFQIDDSQAPNTQHKWGSPDLY